MEKRENVKIVVVNTSRSLTIHGSNISSAQFLMHAPTDVFPLVVLYRAGVRASVLTVYVQYIYSSGLDVGILLSSYCPVLTATLV